MTSVQATSGTAALLENGKWADMTIVCSENVWKAHKSVVLIQSDVLEKICNASGPLRSYWAWLIGSQESTESRIDLSGEDESAVAAMVKFLYHGGYDDISNSLKHAMPVFHVKVYVIASKYSIHPLRTAALDKFKESLVTTWWTDGFAQAIEEIYADDRGGLQELQQVVVLVTKARAAQLFAQNRRNMRFKNVAWSTPAFTAEVLQMMACQSAPSTPSAPSTGLTSSAMGQYGLVTPEDSGVGMMEPEDYSKRVSDMKGVLRPDWTSFDPSASMDEPEEEEYRCPGCNKTFWARIWPCEIFPHPCPAGVVEDEKMLNTYSGNRWNIEFRT